MNCLKLRYISETYTSVLKHSFKDSTDVRLPIGNLWFTKFAMAYLSVLYSLCLESFYSTLI